MTNEVILQVKDLKTYFTVDEGLVKAVDGVSFDLHKGRDPGNRGGIGFGQERHEPIGHQPHPHPSRARSPGGQVLFHGKDLLAIAQAEIRQIRATRFP
jgi:ABC-type dipeptide/oligopeptide/nickel transport system, ATPase component